jgi:hypothetical protein
MKLLAAVLLASFASTAFGETGMLIARQDNAPVQLKSTTHGITDALESAVFTNRSAKSISAYRMGWTSVVAGKIHFYQGPWMNTPGKITAGADQTVPAQGIQINPAAQTMTFFVSEVTFADGTHWTANKTDLLKTNQQ